MKILTVDIGTGTQDIFLYDSKLDLENGIKMVVPSPTMVIRGLLIEAARLRQSVVLTGLTMGGGPSAWGAEALVRLGLPVYATPQAARSFNDDLEAVSAMGIHIVSEDEAAALPDSVRRIEMKDFDYPSIRHTLESLGVSLKHLAAVAVAVFDHGNAPVGVSDRKFRFDYLDQRIRAENRLEAFAYRAKEVPEIMTRLQAVARSASSLDLPMVVMDTAPAAVLGATLDPRVRAQPRVMVANLGNFHTLAFRLGPRGIEGLFEHHTGLLDQPKLERLLCALGDGSLQPEDVFNDQGHGALVYAQDPLPRGVGDFDVVITGPRRSLFKSSRVLRPYFAVPFGDMMIAGCFGLLAATAGIIPELGGPILESLHGAGGSGSAPWDVD